MKNLELFIGLRYFRSKKSNKAISIISFITIAGISIGIMALIVVLSVMNGFQNTIREKIINTGFHVYLTSYGKRSLIYDYNDLIKQIKKEKDVIVATPFFKGQVIVRSTLQRIMAIDFHGISPNLYQEDKSFFSTVNIVEGTSELKSRDDILLGQELARYLDVHIGDDVDIISPQGGKLKLEGRLAPIMRQYRVSGIFKTGYYEYDLKLAFTSLQSLQDLFNKPNASWGIGIKIKNIFDAPRLAKKLSKTFNHQYQTMTWMDLNYNLFTALKNEKTMMSLIVFLIIIVASFNIASTLIMMVTEKKKEIAILKAFGASSKQITNIFMFSGIFMGLTGIILGLCSGFIVAYHLEKIFNCIERIINFIIKIFYSFLNVFTYVPFPDKYQILAKDVYYLDKLPIEIFYSDIIAICVGAVIISIIFSYLPARRAAKFKPMEIIRYE